MSNSTSKLQRWLTLTAVCLGFFMALLDVTVVNVALPTIQTSFHASFSTLQWVINSYTLIFAAVLLLVSKLGDLWGRKLIFNISLAIFTIFSLACSLAPNMMTLIIFRGIQGIGGAGMMSLSMSIIVSTFPKSSRGLALGIWGSVAGLSTALGPLVGGILLSFFNWESIFIVNLPIGVIAFILALIYIPEIKVKTENKHIDWSGMILSFAFMLFLVLGLIQKEGHQNYSWFNWHVSSLLGIGIILMLAFGLLENHSKAPMLHMGLLRNRKVVGAALSNLTLGISIYALFTYIIVLLQNYMGYSALQSGLRLMLISVFALILGPISGSLSNKIKSSTLITFSLLLGGIGLIISPMILGNSKTWEVLIPTFIMIGIANALINPISSNIAVSSVKEEYVGMVSGLLNVGKQFGTSFGLVILGLAMNTSYSNGLAKSDLTSKLVHTFESGGPFSGNAILPSLNKLPNLDEISNNVFHAFYHGMNSVSMTAGIIFIATAVLCFFLLKDRNQE